MAFVSAPSRAHGRRCARCGTRARIEQRRTDRHTRIGERTANVSLDLAALSSADPDIACPIRAALRAVPNPFNPRTEIAFTVAEAGEVSLEVFDVRGRKIRTLASGTHAVGHYSVVWEGTDQTDRPAGSGVYYLRLRTAQGSVTERVVLLR